MKSRLMMNIMLLALVIALSIIAYNSTDKISESVPKLTTLAPDAVSDILIRHRQREIRLHRQEHGWIMTRPVRVDANDFRIGTLLKLLGTTSHADYAIDTLDLADYALQQPVTTIRFDDVEIAFGNNSPVNGDRYVLAAGRLHLIDDSFYPLLSSQTGTLIARELLPGNAEIAGLALPGTRLSRNPDGSWRSDTALSTDAIRQTLDNWKHTQAFGVHNYLQREVLALIEVQLAGQTEPLRFTVTDTDPWLIIARPELDIEYHFNLEAYDGLLRPGADSDLPEDIAEELQRVPPGSSVNGEDGQTGRP